MGSSVHILRFFWDVSRRHRIGVFKSLKLPPKFPILLNFICQKENFTFGQLVNLVIEHLARFENVYNPDWQYSIVLIFLQTEIIDCSVVKDLCNTFVLWQFYL